MRVIVTTFFIFSFCFTTQAQNKKTKTACLKVENERDSLARMVANQAEIIELAGHKYAEQVRLNEYEIVKLKKEAEVLKKIMKSYIHTIDSMYTVNKEMDEKIKRLEKKK